MMRWSKHSGRKRADQPFGDLLGVSTVRMPMHVARETKSPPHERSRSRMRSVVSPGRWMRGDHEVHDCAAVMGDEEEAVQGNGPLLARSGFECEPRPCALNPACYRRGSGGRGLRLSKSAPTRQSVSASTSTSNRMRPGSTRAVSSGVSCSQMMCASLSGCMTK
jgi:hypothetical protein